MPESETPLFFHEGDVAPGRVVRLDDEEAVHAVKSLRLKAGDLLTLLDGKGGVSEAEVLVAKPRHLEVKIRTTRTAPPPAGPPLWLGAALIRGPRYDFIVEKATELGAAGIIPVISRYTEIRPAESGGRTRPERWRRLAIAAMKQSQRFHLPEIAAPTPLESVLEDRSFDPVWVADPGPPTAPPQLAGGRPLLLVGPEGGWHDSERRLFQSRNVTFISLGGNRLRAETASLALLVLAAAALGRMGMR